MVYKKILGGHVSPETKLAEKMKREVLRTEVIFVFMYGILCSDLLPCHHYDDPC